MKNVLEVGNCDADHTAIVKMLQVHFDARVMRTHGMDDTLRELNDGAFDLVLVNRIADRDATEGLEIIRRITGDAALAAVPVMMITNFEEHQSAAVSAGAKRGFGKAQLDEPATAELLSRYLG